MEIEIIHDGFCLSCDGVELMRHTSEQPFICLTQADFHYASKNGQHLVKNRLANWIPLTGYELGNGWVRFFNGEVEVKTQLTEEDQGVRIDLCLPEGFNFACLWLPASAEEAVYGGGMQFSHLNLRGKQFPIWTCEAGVGRNKRHLATILADLVAGAGGNYWTTYNPQPVFLTSSGSGYMLDSDNYSCLDFRGRDAYRIEFLGNASLHCFAASNLAGLVGKVAQHSGIQPAPPDWVFEGGILGIQGGLEFVRDTLDQLREAGAALTGVWTQDWQGIRMTPTGKRLFWNWQADDSLYPQLSEEIEKQLQLNTRWLGYLNPYFNSEGEQYKIAHKRGYLVKDTHGGDTFRLISEFTIGMLDPTNPEACEWYKHIIQDNLLGLGMRGWMADYGEDVTEDQRFKDGQAGAALHNIYPRLWAKINREAVEAAGLQNESLVFHRSGYSGQNRWYNNQWGGDQLVGWDEHDGFPSAVTGGLSACLSGIQYYHSDAGGYTTLGWYKRSKELLARWNEANAFSPILRTHEGNRPWVNAQPWTDADTVRSFVRATKLHAALAPYLKRVSADAQLTGIGMMRPFCLTNPGQKWQIKKDAWYLGDDFLVFPVLKPGVTRMKVEIPEGEWVHLFNGRVYGAAIHTVECPLGQPPVFFRRGSAFTEVFEGMRNID